MYCSKCGKELPEGSQFCPNCGNSVNAPAVPPQSRDSSGHDQDTPFSGQSNTPPEPQSSTPQVSNEEVRCPRCGAVGCTPINKTNVTGGGYGCCSGGLGALVLGPLGLLCGACGRSTKTTNTLVWVCPKCGHEFRVISKEDAKKNYMTLCAVLFGMGAVAESLLCLMNLLSGSERVESEHSFGRFGMAAIWAVIIAYLALGLYRAVYKQPPVEYTYEEKEDLKKRTIIMGAAFSVLSFFMLVLC